MKDLKTDIEALIINFMNETAKCATSHNMPIDYIRDISNDIISDIIYQTMYNDTNTDTNDMLSMKKDIVNSVILHLEAN